MVLPNLNELDLVTGPLCRQFATSALYPGPGKKSRGMTVKIGINPITWTNDDVPALGGDTPLETCLSETVEAGYRGTELGGKFPRQTARLGPRAGARIRLV